MTTAIVLGASGLVGKALIEELVNDDAIDNIIAITRRKISDSHAKVKNHVVDFDRLSQFPQTLTGDVLFSCLGTTKSQAGSIDAQRRVDVDYQYQAAQIALSQGVKHYLLVSSSGANIQSHAPYFQMKGELEEKIKALPFEKISLFQPSLLVGKRERFRLGETLGRYVLPIMCLLPGLAKYKPITAEQVAKKMLNVYHIQHQIFSRYTLDELFSLPSN